MVKLRSRVIAIILLGIWSISLCSSNSSSQYRSLEFYTSQEDIGEIVLFIIYVIVGEIGKKLDKGYVCPVYCSVDHIHRWRCNDAKKAYLQGDYDVFRSNGNADTKQPKSDLRSAGGVWIGCSDSDSLVGIF